MKYFQKKQKTLIHSGAVNNCPYPFPFFYFLQSRSFLIQTSPFKTTILLNHPSFRLKHESSSPEFKQSGGKSNNVYNISSFVIDMRKNQENLLILK